MITNASIQNFKGIKKCNIDGFGTINILIGKNDVCKSTILEAMYYTLKEFTGAHLRDIIGRRTNILFGARELWYNYNTSNIVSMTLVFDRGLPVTLGMDISLKGTTTGDIEIICTGTATNETVKSQPFPLSVYSASNWKPKSVFHEVSLLKDLTPNARDMIERYVTNSQFLDSANKNDVGSIENIFGKVKSQGRASDFNKYLLTIFEKGSKVKFLHAPDLDDPGKYKVAIIEPRRRVFLSGLGDGIRYGMQIIGTGLTSTDACLFIEEIESNQHPASLRKLIDFITGISTKSNLQLFITTHNPLVWRYFFYHFKTEKQREAHLRCFHVNRDSLTGEVSCDQVSLCAADQMKVTDDLFGNMT